MSFFHTSGSGLDPVDVSCAPQLCKRQKKILGKEKHIHENAMAQESCKNVIYKHSLNHQKKNTTKVQIPLSHLAAYPPPSGRTPAGASGWPAQGTWRSSGPPSSEASSGWGSRPARTTGEKTRIVFEVGHEGVCKPYLSVCVQYVVLANLAGARRRVVPA